MTLKAGLADTVFVCVDIQERPKVYWTPERYAATFKESHEFGIEELNAAVDHFFDVLLPNAVKAAEWADEIVGVRNRNSIQSDLSTIVPGEPRLQ